MSQEIKGLENRIPVRMVYTDTLEEVLYKSAAAASRASGIPAQTIRESLNPLARKKYIVNNRRVVFRIKKEV